MSITYETLATMDAKAYYKNEFYPLLKDTNGKNVDIVILAQCLLKNKKKEDLLTIGCIDPLPSNSKTRVKCKFDKAAKKVTIFTADKLAVVQDIFDQYKIELKSYAVEGEPEIAVSEEDVKQAKSKLKAELALAVNFIKQGYAKLEVGIPQEISASVKQLIEDLGKAAAIGEVKQLFNAVETLRKTVEDDLNRLANATEIKVPCKLQYDIKPSNSAYPLDNGNLLLLEKCELGDRHSGPKMNTPLHQHWNNGGEGISFCYLEIVKEDKEAAKTYTFEVPVLYDHAPTRDDNTYYWKNGNDSSGPSDFFGKTQKKYQALTLEALMLMR